MLYPFQFPIRRVLVISTLALAFFGLAGCAFDKLRFSIDDGSLYSTIPTNAVIPPQ